MSQANKWEVTEVCPHCMSENTILWNEEKDGYTAFCPYCGEDMMLCSICPDRDNCDQNEDGDCKHKLGIYHFRVREIKDSFVMVRAKDYETAKKMAITAPSMGSVTKTQIERTFGRGNECDD